MISAAFHRVAGIDTTAHWAGHREQHSDDDVLTVWQARGGQTRQRAKGQQGRAAHQQFSFIDFPLCGLSTSIVSGESNAESLIGPNLAAPWHVLDVGGSISPAATDEPPSKPRRFMAALVVCGCRTFVRAPNGYQADAGHAQPRNRRLPVPDRQQESAPAARSCWSS